MRQRLIVLSIFTLFLNGQLLAIDPVEKVKLDTMPVLEALDSTQFEPDDPIVAVLDSLYYLKIFQLASSPNRCATGYDFPADSVPVYSDSIIKLRLARMDSVSPINFKYNDYVKNYIALYSNHRRILVSRVMGLSKLYYPLFEEELAKRNMPLELKHLSVVESALNPSIRSRAGAEGLWQFMYRTGKYFGMNITSYIDERRDPIVSTQTACEYLSYLHGLYDDWFLALAAYNAGPGNVNKAIRRSGGKKTYWEVRPFLPRETRGYVPAFIAVNYIMNHTAEHNIHETPTKYTYEMIDTIHVKKPVSFAQIASVLCIDQSELKFLNPQYKQDFIPYTSERDRPYVLVLPSEYIGDFVNNERTIYEYKFKEEVPEMIVEVERKIHRVRSGQSLGLIAQRYNVKTSDIKQWNNLRKNTIHPGQKLIIYSSTAKAKTTTKTVASKTKKNDGNYIYHTIQKGDTLWDIANKYDGATVSKLKELNNINNSYRLKPGSKIKVGNQGS